MGQHRIVREPVQILDNADAFGVGLRTPVSFECFAKSLFYNTVSKDFAIMVCNQSIQIVFVELAVEIQIVFKLKMNAFQLHCVVFAKQVV